MSFSSRTANIKETPQQHLIPVITSTRTKRLERIPDQFGYLVMSEGAVLASSGDLENDKQAGSDISELVSTACGFHLHHSMNIPFICLSLVFGEHTLLVTVSGQRVFVEKRQNRGREPTELPRKTVGGGVGL
ncbi:PREDICTED: ragulator complex protein LAMTOR4-like [Elephantulus edwardii]|uniref:ragulator complex protein LAMTOR4-like n=1 Tax=Elephantulus edwardii TaxID=28737 RepID=UPI0003F0AA52|nr:PREDICTED: ragulator complex protein LAMTOR4-like [Elephantulus edwardii]